MIEAQLNSIKSSIPTMVTNGGNVKPLFQFPVNDTYLVAVYQGKLSKFDLLIKYRQKENEKWSRIRTPKHIHWAVDLLIKMHLDKESTKSFLSELIKIWNKTKPIKSEVERDNALQIQALLEDSKENFKSFQQLSKHGEYSINFLILLAKLLMIQEKTNREDAYMFKNLLDALEKGCDIFKIVSIATHR